MLKDSGVDKCQLLNEISTAIAARLITFEDNYFSFLFFFHEVDESSKVKEVFDVMIKQNIIDILDEILSSSSTPEICVCSVCFSTFIFHFTSRMTPLTRKMLSDLAKQ